MDPWCRHKPKIIAGDGTHIGVDVKNLNLDKSVQKVDDKDTTRKNYTTGAMIEFFSHKNH